MQWPDGCLGYAVNLVRPVNAANGSPSGYRARVLTHLLGSTLVFETIAQASAYREHVTQVSIATKLS